MKLFDLKLESVDLIFVSSTSLISKLILWGSKNKENKESLVSHVAGIIYPSVGILVEANITGVETSPLSKYSTSKHKVAIYRAKNIPKATKLLMSQEASRRVGKRYGFASILQHLIDHKLFGGKVIARKLEIPNSEICSELWGSIYKQFGYDFDKNMTPDGMLDFCINNPDKYQEIMPLERLE